MSMTWCFVSRSRRIPFELLGVAIHVSPWGLFLLSGCGITPADGGSRGAHSGSGLPSPSQGAEGGGSPLPSNGTVPTGDEAGASLGGNLDGGGGDGMAHQPCTMLGATRSCCGGTQTCLGAGEFAGWGPCLDSTGAAAVCHVPCGSTELACDAGTEAGLDAGFDAGNPPPDGGCGTGMECKPGSFRYCDNPIAAWSKSVCDPTGHWGPCKASPSIPGCGSNYAPDTCCTARFICCQWEVNGPFVDFGGACAALACH
ncbi:MAG: hypothetical protein M3O36_21895 [Myxococcota bacterium]|nr:hypothetical protein [Myxococcota bacterium]